MCTLWKLCPSFYPIAYKLHNARGILNSRFRNCVGKLGMISGEFRFGKWGRSVNVKIG